MSRASQVIATMVQQDASLATCESVTGGGLGAALTSVAGASAVYRGGLITYARDLKSTLAQVDPELIEAQGVVSELTAVHMALGTQAVCGADWAVATTGVAGPAATGGAKVGTVWFAVTGPGASISETRQYTEVKRFHGDREAICGAAVDHALTMLLRILCPGNNPPHRLVVLPEVRIRRTRWDRGSHEDDPDS